MRYDNEMPSLEELLDRYDLSHMDKMDLIRMHAEAKRAEYITECAYSLISKIKAFFVVKKPVMGSPVSHA